MRTLLMGTMLLFAASGTAVMPSSAAKPKSNNKAKTPHVESITLGGHVGSKVNVCLTDRVLGENVEELIEPFRHKEESWRWQSEFWGKWMLGAAGMYRYSKSPELYEKMKKSVAEMIATQEPDGYIGNYAPKSRLEQWDIWGRKYVLRGLLEWYDLSGDKATLNAARKQMDCLINDLNKAGKKIVQTGNFRGMPSASVLNAVVKLYKATGDKKYLDYAEQIVTEIESPDGAKLIEKAFAGVPVSKRFPRPESWFTPENGQKAYEMMSCYEGLLDLYNITKNENYFKATRLVVDNIIKDEINIGGSGSAHECWYGGNALQTRPTYHTMETCVTTTWLQLLDRMLNITGESRYADCMEQTIYNALLASLKLDGSRIAKYIPLEGVHVPGEQQCGLTTNCCNANGPRGFALIANKAYTVKPAELTVNFYVPSSAVVDLGNKMRVSLEQKGDYPKGNSASITVKPEKDATFALKLRIPEWSKGTKVAVNGKDVDGVKNGSYLTINRTWKSGDEVAVTFDMNPRINKLNDFVALNWGPIVLARDSRLNDGDVDEAANVKTKDGKLVLTPAQAPSWAWMCFKAPVVLGLDLHDHAEAVDVTFCDFSSAGNTWSTKDRYRVWLPKSLNVSEPED